MKKGSAFSAKIRTAPFVLLLTLLVLPGISFASGEPIGALAELSGEVLLKSMGSWGGETVAGLPIHSGDKIVTADGKAELTFTDGTRVTMCQYSILEFKQWTIRGLPIIKPDQTRRRFILYMGKILIDTDYKKMRSEVAAPPVVFGLRGDAGTTRIVSLVSINQEGEVSLAFDEGDRSFIIGPYEIGIEESVPPRIAKRNKLISRAYTAWITAIVAQNADEAALDKGVSEETRKLAWIRADKAKVLDERFCADYLKLWTPDKQVLADARENFKQAKMRLESIVEAENAILDADASEEEWIQLQQDELDNQEEQRALAGLEEATMAGPEGLSDSSPSMDSLEGFNMPMPGAFSDRDPCN